MKPGSIGWLEIHTAESEQVAAFYSRVAGLRCVCEEDDNYNVFPPEGTDAVFGIIISDEDATSAWIPYIVVADLAASVAEAKELGAKLGKGIQDAPGYGAYCIIQDPFGARTALFQSSSE